MSEKKWKVLTLVIAIIGLIPIGFLLAFSINPDGTVEFKPTGPMITLLVISLLFIAFGVFESIRANLTKGINIKTFLYTIIAMALFIFIMFYTRALK